MVSQELIEMLNRAVSMELQVSIQYMWQHVKVYGFNHIPIAEELRKIAIEEMKHAESISERIDYLGGDPTTKPAEITLGKKPREMIEIDMKAEEGAIAFYKQIIEKAMHEKDYVTWELFQDILSDEEDHHYVFRTLLED
jgi:bacterioferritin